MAAGRRKKMWPCQSGFPGCDHGSEAAARAATSAARRPWFATSGSQSITTQRHVNGSTCRSGARGDGVASHEGLRDAFASRQPSQRKRLPNDDAALPFAPHHHPPAPSPLLDAYRIEIYVPKHLRPVASGHAILHGNQLIVTVDPKWIASAATRVVTFRLERDSPPIGRRAAHRGAWTPSPRSRVKRGVAKGLTSSTPGGDRQSPREPGALWLLAPTVATCSPSLPARHGAASHAEQSRPHRLFGLLSSAISSQGHPVGDRKLPRSTARAVMKPPHQFVRLGRSARDRQGGFAFAVLACWSDSGGLSLPAVLVTVSGVPFFAAVHVRYRSAVSRARWMGTCSSCRRARVCFRVALRAPRSASTDGVRRRGAAIG